MKSTIPLFALAAFVLASAPILQGQVPGIITYQGRVTANGANFSGDGQFKFALLDASDGQSLWSNDGTSVNGSAPAAHVTVSVADGLFTVPLGDTALPGMVAIPTSVFTNADVRLRIWFNDGVNGFAQLTPDQRITSAGYAMMSANVPDGLITTGKLAPGVLAPANFPANSITSTQLADSISLGTTEVSGRLDVYRTSAGTPAVSIVGNSSSISTYGSDGLEQIRLHGTSWGELLLRNSLPNNATAVNLTAQGSTGGRLTLNNTNGSSRAILEGENTGGLLTLYTADGNIGAILYGNEGQGSGALSLRNTNGSPRFRAYGGPTSGLLQLYDVDGTETVTLNGSGNGSLVLRQGDGSAGIGISANNGTGGGGLSIYRDDGTFAGQITVADATRRDGFIGLRKGNDQWGIAMRGQNSATGGGAVFLYDGDGSATVVIEAAEGGTAGSQMLMRKADGVTTIQLDAEIGSTGGGYLDLRKADGSVTIVANGDTGTVRAQVVEITGGSDLSENFDIHADAAEPGMIVSIDPKNPGDLVLSSTAYDKRVAGIISGAGGVQPGMLMGQRGSVADGKHPVALTGRVYCWMDADAGGAIEPGDSITTSATPGHGMKAADPARASGAILGKAMSSLDKGTGLVLVLVNLQ